MKKLTLLPLLGLLAVAAYAVGQGLDTTYTRPAIPNPALLSRLNLVESWHTYLAMDGVRDGIYSVQVLGDQMVVQNRSGIISLVDTNDGTTLWRAQPGTPYLVSQDLAFNRRYIFAVRGANFYALDRKTGRLQWEMILPHGVSATPFADDDHFYLCLLTRELYAYDLPETIAARQGAERLEASNQANPAATDKKPAKPGFSASSSADGKLPPPQHMWTYSAETRLERAPIATSDRLAVSGVAGVYFACAKANGRVLYRFRADAPVTAPLGQQGGTAFMASQDFNLYAVDIERGRILWRFTGGGPILTKPQVQDDGAYLNPFEAGLYRIDRETGQQIWHTNEAQTFLAANKKFVYALDRNGRMLVLDYRRGNTLGSFDSRGFQFPVSNVFTDRLYLLNHNGLLVCLHDRDYRQPLLMKTSPEALGNYAVPPVVANSAPAKKAPARETKPAKAKPKPKAEDEGDM